MGIERNEQNSPKVLHILGMIDNAFGGKDQLQARVIRLLWTRMDRLETELVQLEQELEDLRNHAK